MIPTNQQLRVVSDATAASQPEAPLPTPPKGTIYQENAARFASQPEEYAAQEMRAASRDAVALLVAGQPGRAYARFMRSYIRQVRILGLGYAAIPGLPFDLGGPLR